MYIVKNKNIGTKSAFIAISAIATTIASASENIDLSITSKNHEIKSIANNIGSSDHLATLNSEWKFDFSASSLYKIESNIEKSERLRETFNFGVKQWCAILGVARETHYKWLQKPNTEMKIGTLNKLVAMDKLLKAMEPEHLKFLSTLAFGRQKIDSVALELTKVDFSEDSVDEFYDKYYFKLEGLLKRSVA
jgi:hypothetical protein